MSVFYSHWFAVSDLDWQPERAVAERVHRTLVKWQLATAQPELFKIVNGEAVKPAAGETPHYLDTDCAFLYAGVTSLAVREILGPPSGDSWNSSGEGYLEEIVLVLGSDLKVLSGTAVEVDLRGSPSEFDSYPPWISTRALRGLDLASATSRVRAFHPMTGAPMPQPPGFTGMWRCGLKLACYTDHPSFIWEETFAIPNSEFRADLEAAFGTSLVEVGVFT